MPCSWIRRFNIVKMLLLHNLIYRLNVIPVRIPASYFIDNKKTDSKVYMERQKFSQYNAEDEKQIWKNHTN